MKFLQQVMAKSPHAEVQGEACLALAQSLMQRHDVGKNVQENPTYVKQMGDALGKELAEELAKLDLAKTREEAAGLYRVLAEKHVPNMKTDAATRLCQMLSRGADKGGEAVLRILLEKNAKRDVQGVACLCLAQALKHRADGLTGKDAEAADKLFKESEGLFERGAKEFADVKFSFYGTVGSKAKSELYDIRHLTVGKEAPDVEGEDQDGKKFKLSDYRGKVVFLDFWSQY
jgi:hypothetical protein